jgi:hypothetical protein
MKLHLQFRSLAARTALAVLLTAGVVACGSDSNKAATTGDKTGDATTTTAAKGDSAACTAMVAFNDAASGDTDDSTPEASKALGAQLGPLWDKAAPAAPASVKDDVAAVTKALDDLKTGDNTAFDADATFESFTKALGGAIDACGFAKTSVKAVESNGEYHFEGLPATIKAGTVAFELTNTGAEPHVLALVRKNDGENRSAKELLALPEEEGQKAGTEVPGGTFAPPGAEGSGLATLKPGNYVYFCPIPIGENGPPHFTKGMYGEFTVE